MAGDVWKKWLMSLLCHNSGESDVMENDMETGVVWGMMRRRRSSSSWRFRRGVGP